MGNHDSKRRASVQRLPSANIEKSFVMVSNLETEVFRFFPEHSYVVAYAINRQTSPRFSHRTLGDSTVLDSRQVCLALIDKGIVPKEHVMLLTATKDEDLCVAEGMRRSFLEQAKRVGKNGIFVFFFSGHGIKFGQEWGLAPADFDYTDRTYVTGPVLNRWLQEARCVAAKVLFIFDCCYSGGLADEMTAKDPFQLRSGLYVVSACAAFETSLTIGPLRHSIFAYFLAYALRMVKCPCNKLPLHQVVDECSILSTAMSSLLISYDPSYGLKFGTMQPELRYLDFQTSVDSWVKQSLRQISVGESSVCQLDRSAFVLKYFREDENDSQLCSLCLGWLGNLGDEGSPLAEFSKRGLLKDEVLLTCLCCIMWSIASIHLDTDKTKVDNRNIFLLGFVHAAEAFGFFKAPNLTLNDVKNGLEFYQAVLEANSISDANIRALHSEITADLRLQRKMNALKSVDPLQSLQPSLFRGTIEKIEVEQEGEGEGESKGEEEEENVFKSLAHTWWVPLTA